MVRFGGATDGRRVAAASGGFRLRDVVIAPIRSVGLIDAYNHGVSDFPSERDCRQTTRPRILFVCTGNVFRSLTAEHALRASLGTSSQISVTSAGTADYPCVVHPFVSEYLLAKGFDVRHHCRRTLTSTMLDGASVIAMSTEHRVVLADRFHFSDALLFTEACGLAPEPLPDVDEAVPDYETNPSGVEAHLRTTIDRILELTPMLAKRCTPTSGRMSFTFS